MPEIEDFLELPLETQRRQLKRLVYENGSGRRSKGNRRRHRGRGLYSLQNADRNEVKYNLLRPELLKIIHLRQDYRLLDFLENLFGRVPIPYLSPVRIKPTSTGPPPRSFRGPPPI